MKKVSITRARFLFCCFGAAAVLEGARASFLAKVRATVEHLFAAELSISAFSCDTNYIQLTTPPEAFLTTGDFIISDGQRPMPLASEKI